MCPVYCFNLSFSHRPNNILGAQKNVAEFINKEMHLH